MSNQGANVLIVDDERAARFGMRRVLEKEGYQILEAENGAQALDLVDDEAPDLILLDLNMPGMGGFEVMDELETVGGQLQPMVVVVTGHGSERNGVEAMRKGAYDYLAKPYDIDELRLTARRALDSVKLQRENRNLKDILRNNFQELEAPGLGGIVGGSKTMRRVFSVIEKVAPLDVTVLIQGESGTGKELVARELHRRSPRSNQPFVAVNCAALPDTLIESELFGHEKGAFTGASNQREGKFERAGGGTIFLDEVGDMSLQTQAKLLRVLEERRMERLGGNTSVEVDVRVLSATNKDLHEAMEEGVFREDLYYRLKVVEIQLPPLRRRAQDISLLVEYMATQASLKHSTEPLGVSPEAMEVLCRYPWPGNVRELKHAVEQAAILAGGDRIEVEDLPAELSKEHGPTPDFALDGELSFSEAKKLVVERFETDFLTNKLRENDGNISQTARQLDMHRQTLQQKLKSLGINAHKFKGE